jgi:FG-GAP repeat
MIHLRNLHRVALVRAALVAGGLAWSSTALAADLTAGGATTDFGYSVAIDGNTAAVGAIGDSQGNGDAVYVFVQSGGTWTLQQALTPANPATGDEFGYAVALSGDTLLVGAPFRGNFNGAVDVFTRSGSTWTQVTELTEPSPTNPSGDCFGCALALRGSAAFVGAPDAQGELGEVYLYSPSWTVAGSWIGTVQNGTFGGALAIDGAGSTVLVGVPGFAAMPGTSAGQAVVLGLGGGGWTQQAVLSAGDAQPGDQFGYSVGVDNGRAVIGAPGRQSFRGAAYVYSGSGASWTQGGPPLVAQNGVANDYFGLSAGIGGGAIAVGAYRKPQQGVDLSGEVYVFSPLGGGWVEHDDPGAPGEELGWSVAVSGTTALAGAIRASAGASGVAHTFSTTFAGPSTPALGDLWPLLMALLLAAGVAGLRRRSVGPAALSLMVLGCVFGTAACSDDGSAAGPGATPTPSPTQDPVAPPAVSTSPTNPSDTGSIGASLTLPAGQVVNAVQWSVTGPNGSTMVVKSGTVGVGNSQTVSFTVSGIPAGSGYRILLSATSVDGTASCTGAATFNVLPRMTTGVTVLVQCNPAGQGGHGVLVSGQGFNCAAVDGVSANPLEATVGSSIALIATASAPVPADITYSWSAPSGHFDSNTSATPQFTCGAPGSVPVTLVVGDGPVPDGAVCDPNVATATIDVQCDPGDAGVTVPPPPSTPALPPWAVALLAAGLVVAVGSKRRFVSLPE